jgi:hypothetical protein
MEVTPMTEMMSDVNDTTDPNPVADLDGLDEELVNQLVDRAKAGGLRLTGEGGVLQQLTKPFGLWQARSCWSRPSTLSMSASSSSSSVTADWISRRAAGEGEVVASGQGAVVVSSLHLTLVGEQLLQLGGGPGMIACLITEAAEIVADGQCGRMVSAPLPKHLGEQLLQLGDRLERITCLAAPASQVFGWVRTGVPAPGNSGGHHRPRRDGPAEHHRRRPPQTGRDDSTRSPRSRHRGVTRRDAKRHIAGKLLNAYALN